MTKKMTMLVAACLLVVFAAVPCFAQVGLEETMLRDGVEVCPCDCLVSCPIAVPGDITAQFDGLEELKDCVSADCTCDCVPQGE